MKTNFQKLMTGISGASLSASIILGIGFMSGHGNGCPALILLAIGIITFQFSD